MTKPARLALFDLDHTLLPLDSDYQWADFLARTGRAGDPDQARARNEDLMRQYDEGRLSALEACEFMLGLLARHDPVDLAAWHEQYMAEVIRPALTPQAVALVRNHLVAGDLVAIVSATNTYVTAPIARAFGVQHLLGTIPEVAAGRYTGQVQGTPCFREGKITHVNAWLDGMGLSLDQFEQSWFYSDSMNDVPLMSLVTTPVATNPSPTLRAWAQQHQWQIIDLFAQEHAPSRTAVWQETPTA